AHKTQMKLLKQTGCLGSSFGMSKLCNLKGGCLIGLLLVLYGKDNPGPDVGQGTHGNTMALAFASLALVVVSGPWFTLGRLPGKLVQGIAQRFDTSLSAMGPTGKHHRRGPCQSLQTRRISIPCAIIPNFCQQARGKPFACSGKRAIDGTVSMGQKKVFD